MSSLLNARKRAEEFEALLNGTSSSRRADLDRLAGVVTTLREHSGATPRPDFTASLREQLMAEAATVLTGEAKTLALPVRRAGARQRRIVAAATAAVFIGGTTGMAAASQNALPGDALYPIKRTLERAQAGLNTSDANKGKDILAQAGDRLAEVQDLLGRSMSAPEVPATIDDFSEQAAQGSALLIQAFEDKRNPQDIAAVRSFAASSLTVLQELAKTAPPQAQEALAEAARLLQALDEQALGLCSQCAADLPPLEIADLLLQSSGLQEALDAAAKVDNNRVKQPAKGTQAQAPSAPKAQSPSTPKAQDKPQKAAPPLKETTDKVGKQVNETADPVENLVDQVLPGVGDLLDTVTDDLLGPLLGGQQP